MFMTPQIDAAVATEHWHEPMLPRGFRITKMQRESADVFTLQMSPQTGGDPLAYFPGQFNMLYVFGAGEAPISIAGVTADQAGWIHTVRAVGVVTRAMAKLRHGDTLGLRGPFGSAWPLDEAAGKDVLLIAGGIGLAPLWGLLQAILGQRSRFRNVVLLYGTRAPGDLLYRRALDRLQRRSDMYLGITVDRAGEDWRGHVGVVTALIPRAPFDPANTLAMVCGPEVMMRFTVRELQRRGLPAERIFLSLERNMKCAIGLCGHCQFGRELICRDGPVFRYDRLRPWFEIAEL
jgi:NAD(P)H-flavin reductase